MEIWYRYCSCKGSFSFSPLLCSMRKGIWGEGGGSDRGRDGEREKPVRDRRIHSLWPSSLIGILLLATDASFHNKSPTPCLHCQWILNCMGLRAPYAVRVSPVSHPQPAYQNQYLMQMEESCMCRQKAGKALIWESGNVSFLWLSAAYSPQDNVHFETKENHLELSLKCRGSDLNSVQLHIVYSAIILYDKMTFSHMGYLILHKTLY